MQVIDDLLQYFESRVHKTILKLDFVLQKDNFQELVPFYKFCEKKKLTPSVIYLTSPVQFSVGNLDKDVRLQLINDLTQFNKNKSYVELTQILNNLKQIHP
jgi:hypothetical protein